MADDDEGDDAWEEEQKKIVPHGHLSWAAKATEEEKVFYHSLLHETEATREFWNGVVKLKVMGKSVDLYMLRETVRCAGGGTMTDIPPNPLKRLGIHNGTKTTVKALQSVAKGTVAAVCTALKDNARNKMMHITKENGNMNGHSERTLREIYRKFVTPYELVFRGSPILIDRRTSIMPEGVVRSPATVDPDADDDAGGEDDNDEFAAVTNLLDTIKDTVNSVPSVSSEAEKSKVQCCEMISTVIDIIGKASRDEAVVDDNSPPPKRYLVIMGAARTGKSFFLNAFLEMTEVVPSQYARLRNERKNRHRRPADFTVQDAGALKTVKPDEWDTRYFVPDDVFEKVVEFRKDAETNEGEKKQIGFDEKLRQRLAPHTEPAGAHCGRHNGSTECHYCEDEGVYWHRPSDAAFGQ